MAVAEWKTKEIEDITHLMSSHPVVGIINVGKIPAPQLQKMRQGLRGKALLRVTKNSLLLRALKQAAETAKGIEKIGDSIGGETAIIATETNPFKLFKEIERTKTKAPAKGGDIAQDDITVEKGETPFKPGPVVGELQSAGIPAAIEGGAVVIKQTKTLVKKGEQIPGDVAKMLTRLEIYPMEIGLDLRAVYENKTIFTPDVLKVDSEQLLNNFKLAANGSFNLALKIGYTTSTTIAPLIRKAYWDVISLATHCDILIPETTKNLFSKAYAQAYALQTQVQGSLEKKLDSSQTDKIEKKEQKTDQQKQTKENNKKQEPTKKENNKKQEPTKKETSGEETEKKK